MPAIRPGVIRMQIEPQRLARAVFENHQHRQHTVMVRIHLAERRVRLLFGHERNRGDGDFLRGLVALIGRRRAGRETILVLVVAAPTPLYSEELSHA